MRPWAQKSKAGWGEAATPNRPPRARVVVDDPTVVGYDDGRTVPRSGVVRCTAESAPASPRKPLLPGEIDGAEYRWADSSKPWNPKSFLRRDAQRQETEQLADILLRGGMDVRGEGITLVGLVTNQIIHVPGWANLNILPLVAAPKRDAQARDTEYYITHHPKGKYARYSVVTGGERIPEFGKLGEALTGLSRRISKLAHELRACDVEVVVSALEVTRVQGDERIWDDRTKRWGPSLHERHPDRYDPETYYYHPHVNQIYIPLRHFPPSAWKAILRRIRRKVRAHWRDCGRVGDTREVVKYVTKPADLLAPGKEIGPQELVWLARELHRAKLFNPVGKFREARHDWEERHVRIERVPIGKNRTELREVFQTRGEGLRREDVPKEKTKSAGNIVLAILRARRHACRVPEPVAVVTDYRPDTWEWVRDQKYAVVADAREAAVEAHTRHQLYSGRADLERMIAKDQAALSAARAAVAQPPPISFTRGLQLSRTPVEGHDLDSPSPGAQGPPGSPTEPF